MQQLTNPRELRGLAILSQPDTVSQELKNVWKAKSESGMELSILKGFVKGCSNNYIHEWLCFFYY